MKSKRIDPRFTSPYPLTKALAPLCLADVQGQGKVVDRLRRWLARPKPVAWTFYGATGTGKNSTARALAGELGCDIAGGQLRQQMSGFFDLCAEGLTAAEVQERLRSAWYAAMNKSGWKVVVISECDKLRDDAKNHFLHALDYPPPAAVWIFTTNDIDSLDRRLATRTEPLEFESRAEVLEKAADKWLADLWHAAGQNHQPPKCRDIPGAIKGGHLSYRALVLGLQARLP